jgi:phenylalanyl-tRNA synthetase beta chain
MRIYYSYIQSAFGISCDVQRAAELLTACGLEVEAIESLQSLPQGLNEVVVGKVLEVIPHPDADRLRITQVDVGQDQPLQIVCGAPNVAEGQLVPVALIQATLHPVSGEPFKIKKSKIRGIESHGMICAEDEMGIGTSHDGILVLDPSLKIGTPMTEVLGEKGSAIIEIGLTPNRTDAMSHWGVARELNACLLQQGTVEKDFIHHPNALLHQPPLQGKGNALEVPQLHPESGCTRYMWAELNVQPSTTPEWMKQALEALGIKSIHPVVDITNWVQHELGQPLHAFDAFQAEGPLQIRQALSGESLVTLDGIERKLHPSDVVISDNVKPLCLAGIMGGKNSGVNESTTRVWLECAQFNAVKARKSAKQHGIHTDSSFRFERGVDPEMTAIAFQRALELMQEICHAELVTWSDQNPQPFGRKIISFQPSNAQRLIGKAIEPEAMKTILESLDFGVNIKDNETWEVEVPGCRVDVTREVDVTEEILRIYGFDQVAASSQFSFTTGGKKEASNYTWKERIAEMLTSQGWSEIQNLSLSKSSYYADQEALISILNPLSQDLGVLRADMIHGGLESIGLNINHKQSDLRLYEFGKTYSQKGEFRIETEMLSLWITGKRQPENPFLPQESVTWSDIRKAAEQLTQVAGLTLTMGQELTDTKWDQAVLYKWGKVQMKLGVVSQELMKMHDLKQPVYYLELTWTPYMQLLSQRKSNSPVIHKFPSVRRDLALLVDKPILFQHLQQAAVKAEKKLLKDLFLFDIYSGKNLPEGKKSYAIGFVLQDESATLTDSVIERTMGKIQQALENECGAVLR